VPNCGIPDFPLAKFELGDDDAGYENWFRNTHTAGMVRHLMHHTLKAWDALLPEFEGITNPPAKEREMLNYVEISRPLGSALSPKSDHQNYYGRFTSELGGDTILCPAEPNQFSVVVDKIIVGATEEMRKLADEAIAKVYNPSESRRVEAPLPKNHVQAEFGTNLRSTTLNWYENCTKTSGALSCLRVGIGFCVCALRSSKHCDSIDMYMFFNSIFNIYMSFKSINTYMYRSIQNVS